MKSISSFDSIFLWRVPVDFRKSINGLSAIVQEEMSLDAYSSALFIFSCSRRKRIKILYWDRTGFAIWYKKLEEDLFPWPLHLMNSVVNLTSNELQWVLDGIDFWKIKPHVDAFKSSIGKGIGKQGQVFFKRIYEIEEEIKDLPVRERFLTRITRSIPIVRELELWIKEQSQKSKSRIPRREGIKVCKE